MPGANLYGMCGREVEAMKNAITVAVKERHSVLCPTCTDVIAGTALPRLKELR